MNTPIPYCEESIPAHGPVRSLFVAGKWQVPVEHRPKDWRVRMGLKPDPPPAPPRDWARERIEAGKNAPVKPVQRKTAAKPRSDKRILLTPQELADQISIKGAKSVASELGANEFTLYRILRDAGVELYHRCLECQEPCGSRKRCDECRKKRANVQQIVGRNRRDATIPGHREKRMEYFRLRGHASRRKGNSDAK